jgi:hypothetical protein
VRFAPKNHGEAVAIFRSEIVGALTRRDLDHGELRALFRALQPPRTGQTRAPQVGHFMSPRSIA